MKKHLSLLLFLSCLSVFSQTDELVGDYFRRSGSEEDHLIEYKLTVSPDGTFSFYSYTNHKKGIPWIKNLFGKGTWKADGKIISFFTDTAKDLDEKHTLNFSHSKARFITKPPRDKTERVIKTRLQFFESEIFWIERLEIFKTP
ncbi:MAG: hypothetical protein WBM55_08055 [Muriicola sp.]